MATETAISGMAQAHPRIPFRRSAPLDEEPERSRVGPPSIKIGTVARQRYDLLTT
jgi:hypothetical protein